MFTESLPQWHNSFYLSSANQTIMALAYPFEFTLESGTHVVIKRVDNQNFDFVLKPEEGGERHFSYNDDVEFTNEMEEKLDFDELNALRRFWLEREKEES